ncbi:MAG: chemotaxis response regulator protein-glutamate methylesterase [Fimbriimonadales bacterium]|jgi:two-component system chemotaxis response regulator CheB|nr:chemotaxis response regulator protein-glutamate methylesterase [Fimbriimonadales bacterium]GBC90095.1 Chemotaxis response regulator protein-glutamate methylesterase [bacterium HR14]GIV13389.1 MAG: chemotaxis response regulator protein-glutamate methylesterase [Fimbriimonadales bacterium]CUU10693.1 two-component system, chemotaxis family, response regulator CheB [Armatimonadetes bacterium GBS]CUU35976.1 two-component system, chemotaxis family, response regulator CheB [Armatimonadetes bacteriu
MSKIRVLVVDDSLFMRRMITDILAEDPEIEVVGSARNGQEGLEMARQLQPDVITLDVEMPVMDGITMLERLMKEQPTAVVMVSSLTKEGAEVTLRSLELGAVDFVTKPSGSISLDLYKVSSQILEKVKAAARVPRFRLRALTQPFASRPASTTPAPVPPAPPKAPSQFQNVLVVVGCSTGGPRALTTLMSQLPPDFHAPMLIVQHMPEGFTRSLAERLDRQSPMSVREANAGDRLQPGVAYLAPGGRHLKLAQDRTLQLSQDPPVHGVRPSVDVTLLSVAQHFTGKVVIAILTGMGSDGAMGARTLHAKGARVLAEDESTCVVFGMPRAVIQAGCADRVVPLDQMAQALYEEVQALCKTQAA